MDKIALDNMMKIRKANKQFKLSNDTYAMAFKALNIKVVEEINLDKHDWNNAF